MDSQAIALYLSHFHAHSFEEIAETQEKAVNFYFNKFKREFNDLLMLTPASKETLVKKQIDEFIIEYRNQDFPYLYEVASKNDLVMAMSDISQMVAYEWSADEVKNHLRQLGQRMILKKKIQYLDQLLRQADIPLTNKNTRLDSTEVEKVRKEQAGKKIRYAKYREDYNNCMSIDGMRHFEAINAVANKHGVHPDTVERSLGQRK